MYDANGAASGAAAKPPPGSPAPPCTIIVFGGGDLTRRLLMPALYNLVRTKLVADGLEIIGVDHTARTDEEFRGILGETIRSFVATRGAAATLDQDAWAWLMARVRFLTGDFDNPETYVKLSEILAARGRAGGNGNAVFYLATSPRFFAPIIEQLGAAALTVETATGWRRIVIEKPFGTDLPSARALNARILKVVQEHQVYRMDHFLGKETVQNIMVLRFGNGIFEPLWNRDHIDHVQITAAETVSVEQRGRFYDATGALRDMVPNHMFQLLAMIAMEAPNSFDADAVRSEKAKVIEAVRRQTPEEAGLCAVRGQYTSGAVQGKQVGSYRDDPNVDPASRTETYVAIRLMIDNWRWSDVPFYIRTGKSMAVRRTEIAVQFKRAPGVLFRGMHAGKPADNFMVFRIQPEEGVSLRFAAKVPGPKVRLADVDMNFQYGDYFKADPSTGYETLIYDCLVGDATLFQRADNIEAGWEAVQPLQQAWADGLGAVYDYAAGSAGPAAADMLLAREGRRWAPLGK
jgi:glucose-6-phosphate 1-dehydrogenase